MANPRVALQMAMLALEDVRDYLSKAALSEDAYEQVAEELFSLYRTIAKEEREVSDD